VQETLPRKESKPERPLRRGSAFVVLRTDDAVLVRTRPPNGLLGGMVEAPTSAWEADYDVARAMLDAPLDARWKRLPGAVRHSFTHFPLELTVFFAKVAAATDAPEGMRWTPRPALAGEAVPNAMRKVFAHALDLRPTPPRGSRAR
jgi:A/G-specific adenine glycosylase